MLTLRFHRAQVVRLHYTISKLVNRREGNSTGEYQVYRYISDTPTGMITVSLIDLDSWQVLTLAI